MKRAKKTLAKESSLVKKKADQIHMNRFFDKIIKNIDDDPSSFYNNEDPVEDIHKQLENLNIN